MELVFGIYTMCVFMKSQNASFYLRTAPLIDKKFKIKYEHTNDVKTSRQVQLGVRRDEDDGR